MPFLFANSNATLCILRELDHETGLQVQTPCYQHTFDVFMYYSGIIFSGNFPFTSFDDIPLQCHPVYHVVFFFATDRMDL